MLHDVDNEYTVLLSKAEELSREFSPSDDVEQIIYFFALFFAKKALHAENIRKGEIATEYYRFSRELFSQLQTEALIEHDKQILQGFMASVTNQLQRIEERS